MGKKFCIEMDGSLFGLSGDRLETIKDLKSAQGCKFFVTDFGQSGLISRVMLVKANIRYAEAAVARDLQNEGEFDEPVSIITHWKKKQGKNDTQIFFTAMPSRIYLKYVDTVNEHDDLCAIVPVFSILADMVSKMAPKNPVAVVFRHDKFADLVIGKKNRFYSAARCAAFDTSDEQVTSLWGTVEREISNIVESEAVKIDKIISLNWIDSKENIPLFDSTRLGRPIEHFIVKEEKIALNDTIHEISFPKAVKKFPPTDGIFPSNGKFLYLSERLSPFIMAFFAAAIVINFLGLFYYQSKIKMIKGSTPSIEKRIEHLQNSMPSPPEKMDHMAALKFVDMLFYNQQLPSCKDIVNDISMGISPATIVEQLDINYVDRQVKIKLSGIVNADFDRAYQRYQGFLSSLQQDGYHIDNNAFNTRIDSSRFALELSRGIK